MTRQSAHEVLFVLTIDTEEEWDWEGDFPQDNFAVSNTQKIPEFQAFCEDKNIRPTYFVDYAVVNDSSSVARLKPAVDQETCEIGAHLHPWANPPYYGPTGERESHVVNLPIEHTEAKVDALISRLQQEFNILPTSFRTGRWGINGAVLDLLVKKGFTVDSSMYPFYRNEYFDCSKTPLHPYWPNFIDPQKKGHQRNILEIPASVGFNHTGYNFLYKLYELVNQPPWYQLHMPGIFWRLKLLQKIYLSPEVSSTEDMITLVDSLLLRKEPVIHMYMHSSSLVDGITGVMPEKDATQLIIKRISEVVGYLKQQTNVRFCTISEAASLIKSRL